MSGFGPDLPDDDYSRIPVSSGAGSDIRGTAATVLATVIAGFNGSGNGSFLNSDPTGSGSQPWPVTPAPNFTDIFGGAAGAPDFLDGNFVCKEFLPTNHFYFQLANTFLFLSYLAPNGIYGILYLRVTLAVGSFFFALWGYVILCALDTCIWNIVFFVINFVHAVIIVYQLRPVRIAKEFEELYRQLFLPLRVTRSQFKKVTGCMKEVLHLRAGEPFALERKTKVDKLSLVLTGRFMVSQDGRPLNFVLVNQFLDSPEWFGMSTDEYFQVTIIAAEESSVLVWNRDKLKLTINSDSFLPAVFDHILGKDVVNKLMQVNETCLSNGVVPSSDSSYNEKPVRRVHRADKSDASRQIQDGGDDSQIYEIEPLLSPSDGEAAKLSLNNDVKNIPETSIC